MYQILSSLERIDAMLQQNISYRGSSSFDEVEYDAMAKDIVAQCEISFVGPSYTKQLEKCFEDYKKKRMEMSPAQQGMPPAMPPAQQGMPPAPQGMPPAQQAMPSAPPAPSIPPTFYVVPGKDNVRDTDLFVLDGRPVDNLSDLTGWDEYLRGTITSEKECKFVTITPKNWSAAKRDTTCLIVRRGHDFIKDDPYFEVVPGGEAVDDNDAFVFDGRPVENMTKLNGWTNYAGYLNYLRGTITSENEYQFVTITDTNWSAAKRDTKCLIVRRMRR